MSVRFSIAAVLLLALAIPIAGCGGDDEAGADSLEASSLSKKQYIKQADKRCAEERRDTLNKFIAYTEGAGAGDSRAFENASGRFFAPSLEQQATIIRSLGAPDGDDEQIEALLAQIERSSASLRKMPVPDFSAYAERLRPMAALAGEYGFSQCGSAGLV